MLRMHQTAHLKENELVAIKDLIKLCQQADQTHRQPYLSNILNFDKEMPAFILAYLEDKLVGLLAIYADDKDEPAEVSILVTPAYRRQGIASQLIKKFDQIKSNYQLQGLEFWTEQVFLDQHPSFLENTGLVADEEKEIWLSRGRELFEEGAVSSPVFALAMLEDSHAIASFQAEAFDSPFEVSLHYAQEAISDENSLLYLAHIDGQVVASCTVDLLTNYNYLYGLAVAQAYRGQGIGSALVKYVVNDLIAKNNKDFQIAVEEENIGAWKLYEKLGFVPQTQIVYLHQKLYLCQ